MSSDRPGPHTGPSPEKAAPRRPTQRVVPQALLGALAAHCGALASERTALLIVALNRSDRLQALAQDSTNPYVLAEVARRVQSMMRPGDRYAFVANDEIWLMLASLPDESLAELAGSTLRDTLRRPIHAPRTDGSEAEIRLRPVIGGAWTAQRSIADPMAMVTAAAQACTRARLHEHQILISRLDDDAALMRRDEIRHAGLWVQIQQRMSYQGAGTQAVMVYGADDAFLEANGGNLLRGRFFSNGERAAGSPVVRTASSVNARWPFSSP